VKTSYGLHITKSRAEFVQIVLNTDELEWILKYRIFAYAIILINFKNLLRDRKRILILSNLEKLITINYRLLYVAIFA